MACRILAGLGSILFLVLYAESISIAIEPGRKACFGFNLEASDDEGLVEIEVVKGGQADINYEVLDIYNNVVKSGIKVKSVDYMINVTKTGEYKVCLDNTFSSSAVKIVQLELAHESVEKNQKYLNKFDPDRGKDHSSEMQKITERLMKYAHKAETFQDMILAKHKRHYYLQQSNLSRVNWFSFSSCLLMVAVGVLQVFIVKSLFEEGNRKAFRFW